LRVGQVAQVPDFVPADYFAPAQLELLDRFAQLGLMASREAVGEAGIVWTPELQARTAVVTGCAVGGQASVETASIAFWRDRRSRVPVLTVPRVMPNALASHIAMECGITGPVLNFSTACSSGNHAIGHAFWMVRNGLADLALAGGSEAPISVGHLKAWEAMRVIASDTCRPFSRDRKGMILGEAGAMLVLEPLEVAKTRGVPIYGELVGFGMSADAHHITQPLAPGAAQAMRGALEDGGLVPEQIGYVNAHGTATLANDVMETIAIRTVFAGHADRLAVSATKSLHGHTLGAAGAIEAVATLLALHHGILPPTANHLGPDPACDLDVIPNVARSVTVDYALSNSFAFGGLNAVLAFRRWSAG
jgi:nodulation protein E